MPAYLNRSVEEFIFPVRNNFAYKKVRLGGRNLNSFCRELPCLLDDLFGTWGKPSTLNFGDLFFFSWKLSLPDTFSFFP